MTTEEVKAVLGVKQPRVSQLVKEGHLIAEKDTNGGALKYDRASVERLANVRAMRRAIDAEEASERKLLQDEARERHRREVKLHREREAARIAKLDDLHERATVALERIAECLKKRSSL